jgi:hypothetical protein
MNASLLCKWWWNLDIVRLKYVKASSICLITHRHDDSPVWKDLLQVRHIYLSGKEIKVQSGRNVSFWYDK